MNIVVMAFLAVVVVLMLAVVGDRQGSTQAAPPPAVLVTPADAVRLAAVTVPLPETSTPAAAPATPDRSGEAGTYTAVWGDTVSNLAAEMDGGNRKVNRDAVIHANPSLRRDPDRLFAGQTYDIPADGTRAPAATAVVPSRAAPPVAMAPAEAVEAPAAIDAPAPVVVRSQPATAAAPDAGEGVHQLRYTARTGDTVSVLAAVLLGSDTKANRDTIVDANASLGRDPDRVVDGRVYRIPVREAHPLAAAPQSEMRATARPAAQPDADDLVETGSARQLRYTARPGDTVSTLALALLGSDTAATRAAIAGANESLVRDPDRVVAGQSYWIAAPAAAQR